MQTGKQKKLVVLIHGGGHGAWTWYKISDLLQKAGYDVAALDMAACGINPRRACDIKSLEAYSEPLLKFMENLPDQVEVTLVGHSIGGLSISLAMQMFPHRVSASIFVTAFMPQTGVLSRPLDVVVEKFKKWGDSDIEFSGEGEPVSFLVGRSFGNEHFYQNCSSQDIALADSLRRPFPLFEVKTLLTQDKYGSVKRVYIVCKEDKCLTLPQQLKLIEANPPHNVYEIDNSDHFPLLSCPDRLAAILMEVSATF